MEILVVEDEAGIADFLARGPRAEGYGVRVAEAGEEGARVDADDDGRIWAAESPLGGARTSFEPPGLRTAR